MARQPPTLKFSKGSGNEQGSSQGSRGGSQGKLKDAAGKVLGDREMQAEGKVDKATGKVQSNYGDAKEKAKDQLDKR